MSLIPANKFDNRFVRELPGDPEKANFVRPVSGCCWSEARPTPVASPMLVAIAPDVAQLLDIDSDRLDAADFAEVFSGNELTPGMFPFAACYGGHQFGHWAGQLGDGRAISLGEIVNERGQRWEMQLKGAGKTPCSRGADGRAVMRSSIREFLCSEAMFHLGVPTTRALSLVATGEMVMRDMFYDGRPKAEPGAIVCRVAPSFIRFGNFEILAARQEQQLLETLVKFTIDRDFPELRSSDQPVLGWFHAVCDRTAKLMIEWQRVGFVHGVMNTDNMSILGLTIDYGPYGWIDQYATNWTPNTTDAERHRYAFGKQPDIAHWNLACLGNAIFSLHPSADDLRSCLAHYQQAFSSGYERMLLHKFGLTNDHPEAGQLVAEGMSLLSQSEMDMTLFFRCLSDMTAQACTVDTLKGTFYNLNSERHFSPRWQDWLVRYRQCVELAGGFTSERQQAMHGVNPIYVLRNYLAQEAIDLAEAGDVSRLHELMTVLREPYEAKVGMEKFAQKRPDWALNRAGCSMLSCSS